MTVPVVIPWRDTGDPDRAANLAWCLARWHAYGYRPILADAPGPTFNLAAARNAGMRQVDGVAIVADADVIIPAAVASRAVTLAAEVAWVVPHRLVHRLDQAGTDRLLATPPGRELPKPGPTWKRPYLGRAGGGLIVIRADRYWSAGGYDPTFDGWGREDEAFELAATTLIGRRARLDGPLWHLWHDPGPRKAGTSYRANTARLAPYQAAAGDRSAMAALVGGRR